MMQLSLMCLSVSLGQLITLAGLDTSSLPYSTKPPGSTGDYINGQSRLDTTHQMRAILENSRLDESILSADLQPAYNGLRAGFALKPAATDPTQQYDQPSAAVSGKPGSKFDELYQQALRNAESILSESGNPPDGHVTLSNLYSPLRSGADVPSNNDSHLETQAAQSGLRPANGYLDSSACMPNGHLSTNSIGMHASSGQPLDARRSQGSYQSKVQELPISGGKSRDAVDESVDSDRVETEISEEYTMEEDDIDEISVNP